MNEIQLIRHQLAEERKHAGAVANACATALAGVAADAVTSGSPLAQFRQACVDYLVCVLAWFEERDQRLADVLRARLKPEDLVRHTLEEVLSCRGRSREALEKLEAAVAGAGGQRGRDAWQEFTQYFNSVWSARRDALDALVAADARPADWRAVAGIDADSILEERRRYALAYARVPPGVTLAPPQVPGA
jgi:hypothetical protein